MPDSWWKGCEFESRQENFLLQSQLCMLTLMWCPFYPCVTTVTCKRPQSFCQSTGGRLHLNMLTPFTQRSWSELTMLLSRHSVGTYQEMSSRKLVKEHSVTDISAHWAIVDWSWPKEWNLCARADLHFKKKKSAGRERIVEHSSKILACEEKVTTTYIVFIRHTCTLDTRVH